MADHGKLERVVRPARGFPSLRTAYATIKGFEVMRAPKRGQGAILRFLSGVAGEMHLVHRNLGLR